MNKKTASIDGPEYLDGKVHIETTSKNVTNGVGVICELLQDARTNCHQRSIGVKAAQNISGKREK